MATMLAMVDNGVDAALAARAGADRITFDVTASLAAADTMVLEPLPGPVSLLVRHRPTVAEAARLIAMAAELGAKELRLPVSADVSALPAGLDLIGLVGIERVGDPDLAVTAAAAGWRGLMVVVDPALPPMRLLDAVSTSDLAALAEACRGAGLRLGLSGALEWPDVPRLLALDPDELGFDLALRGGAEPDRSIDPERVKVARDLMAEPARSVQSVAIAEPDRIFVRDWVLSISIGAYARERGAPQRVRFSVEAEIARQGRKPADLRDIVSYDLITDAIRRLVSGHVDLVETLAERIAEAVLSHRRVSGVVVTVEKLDLGPGAVGCRISRRRERG